MNEPYVFSNFATYCISKAYSNLYSFNDATEHHEEMQNETKQNMLFTIFRKAHLSSKKLLEQCQKLEKLWSHVFTATLNLNNITAESQWYTKLTDLIDKQQTAPIWMSESKVIFFKVGKAMVRSSFVNLFTLKKSGIKTLVTLSLHFDTLSHRMGLKVFLQGFLTINKVWSKMRFHHKVNIK